MASIHPVPRKPLSPLSIPPSMDRPLPPIPPMPGSNRLQKPDPSTRNDRKLSDPPLLEKSIDDFLPVPPPPPVKDIAPMETLPNNRPPSVGSSSDNEALLATKLKKRSTWLPGSRSRSRNRSAEMGCNLSAAWIRQGGTNVDYNLKPLFDGQKIPELWIEDADCLIYLFPPSSNRAASFRVPSHLLSSSKMLLGMMQGGYSHNGHSRNGSLGVRSISSTGDSEYTFEARPLDTPPITPQQYPVDASWSYDHHGNQMLLSPVSPPHLTHLYFPTGILTDGSKFSAMERQRLIDIRNLFAFITQQPFVRTPQCGPSFDILMRIAENLKALEFNSIDGSTYGETAMTAFEFYLGEMRLGDVRESREKTLEALVIAEGMRSIELYNEAFAHAVGRYDSIKKIDLPVYNRISQTSRNRIERAQLELKGKQASLELRLANFDFPSLFAGIAISTTSEESKSIRFNAWRLQFQAMRRFVMKYYKDLHGAWPPKANSKKNQFLEGGLSRLVVSMLYKDLCQLYNLLVDRSALTTRSENGPQTHASGDPNQAALRKLLSEYDQSSPPVQPAVPFDVPLDPAVSSVNPGFSRLSKPDQFKEINRKLKSNESTLILTKSHNLDADIKTSFIQAYKEFEYDSVEGKSAQELSDMRYGHWIFLYAVIQSLPLLVMDAPGLRFTEGVEYFLCQPAVGSAPWIEDATATKRAMYRVQNGQGMVSLPSDLVDHGVEAVYHRSHCWTMAKRWLGVVTNDSFAQPPPMDPEFNAFSPLEPPPGFAGAQLGVRPQSRGRSRGEGPRELEKAFGWFSLSSDGGNTIPADHVMQQQRRSIALGLEKLPVSDVQDWNSVHFDSIPPVPPVPAPVPRDINNGRRARDGSPAYSSGSRPISRSTHGRHRSEAPPPLPSHGTIPRDQRGMERDGGVVRPATSGNGATARANPGTTFDDILGAIESQKMTGEKARKVRKK